MKRYSISTALVADPKQLSAERRNEAEREECEPSELVGMQQFRYRDALCRRAAA